MISLETLESFSEVVIFITAISSVICLVTFYVNLIIYFKKFRKKEKNTDMNIVLMFFSFLFIISTTIPAFFL
ncbi:hypothetical protein SAMN05877842_12230 [Ureibacillus acetophenoni]|uniref:Uncharacterized protein n=1 Tax=Ureibacillus acetophenoni TaxID=614649 RepID=A0A285US06_9BACL|nr:hypothetical protein SAMN05877842_12230 [Ureibacillus acetophenoni]